MWRNTHGLWGRRGTASFFCRACASQPARHEPDPLSHRDAKASNAFTWLNLSHKAGPPGFDRLSVQTAHDHDEARGSVAIRPVSQSDRRMEDVLDAVDHDGPLF